MESQRSEQERQAEQALLNSEAEFRTLVDTSPANIWFINADGRSCYANRSYLEFFGKTEAEIAGEGWHTLIHPDDARDYIAAILTAVHGRTPLRVRARMRRHDQQWRWIESQGRPYYCVNNSYLGLVGHNFDITDTLEASRILCENEERMRIATEAAQIYTWEVDEATKTIRYSPNASGILGFEPPVTYDYPADLVHPDDRVRLIAAVERSLEEGTDIAQEYRVINPHNGETIWLRTQAVGKIAGGRARRFMGVSQNITERKRAELNAIFLAEIGDDFARLSNADDIMRVVGEKIYHHLDAARLSFLNINKTADELTGVYDIHDPDLIDCHLDYRMGDLISDACREQLQSGQAIAIDDIETDPRTAGYAEAYRPYAVRAQLLAPHLSDGRWKFLLCVQHRRPYHWRADEIELMHELTARIYLRLERARAENALRESEQEFRAIFESSSVGKAQADAVTRHLLKVNRKFREITLYSHEELIGKDFEELVHPLDRERSSVEFNRMMRGEIPQFDTEKRLLRKDGSSIWVHVNATLLRDSQGKPLRTIAMIQDISARKHAEELLETELADMLRLQETSSRMITEGKIDALLNEILNAAIAVTRADKGTLQLLNMETNQLEILASRGFSRQFLDFFSSVDSETNSVCAVALQARERVIMPDLQTDKIGRHSETATALCNADVRAVQATPFISRSGQLLGMLSTHWREPHTPAERELRLLDLLARQAADLIERHQGEAELKKANRRKDEFLAMLGHELRNPLAPIVTALHLMRLKNDKTTERERNVIERQVNHLIRLVDDLLDVSRITSGKVQLKKQWIELSNIVNRAIETVSPLLEQRKHSLQLEVPSTGCEIYVDAERMAQVVSNLLTNAAKYTETDGKISIRAQQNKEWIELAVSDTGMGINSQLLPQVFDLFTQGSQPLDRSQGGLGLGLTIVRSLVTMHGGTVEAHSAGQGKGSKFTIRLPFDANARPRKAKTPARRAAQTPAGHDKRYILIVDDNEDAADTLKISLEAAGHVVHVAHDGPSALKLAGEIAPDVAVLDIGLPVMDGYELARQLRTQQGLTQLPLIAISGYGQDSDQHRSRAAGFDAHLVKPVDPEQIESLLRNTKKQSPDTP
jgi:PAS domain S-box-containing protein